MQIAGGLYRELCDMPFWDATFGSGVRAAAAVAADCSDVKLHTYASPSDQLALAALRNQGIRLSITSRPSPIAFAYFHPLSVPYIQPPPAHIERQPSLNVSGEAVLRFGFLEGDAVVKANRAVYDPQTWRNPQPFAANGSTADELAVVLNELELQHATGVAEPDEAAFELMKKQGAAIVVVKGGTRGAIVYERSGYSSHIPAYRSTRVFKIGTGDVFSAMFALHWAQKGVEAAKAADLASRSVSLYCETRNFGFDRALMSRLQPVSGVAGGSVSLEGTTETLGQRFVMEEARFALRELGMDVHCPELEFGSNNTSASAILVIDDGLSLESLSRIQVAKATAIPLVTLHERADTPNSVPDSDWITYDFTTAMYLTAWAAKSKKIDKQ